MLHQPTQQDYTEETRQAKHNEAPKRLTPLQLQKPQPVPNARQLPSSQCGIQGRNNNNRQ